MSVIEKAIAWALDVANDPAHGYDQNNRWGPNYDCSSLVISAFKEAGLPLTATYTGNMRYDFLRNGFKDASELNVVEFNMGAGLRRGDVLLNEQKHTAIYLGDGTLVQASINEKGEITGGQSGDQTGKEIHIRTYYNYPWQYVLRYVGEENTSETDGGESNMLPTLKRGSSGMSVKALQTLLKFRGCSLPKYGVDGDFGVETETAVKVFQSAAKLTADGIVGAKTWKALIG